MSTRNDSTKPTNRGVSRREFLTRGAAAAGGLAAAPYLLGGAPAWAAVDEGARVGGRLDVLNWPLYIDKRSRKRFPKETGIKLKYSEGINDNNEFFAKYQEQFAAGDHIGFDLVIPTGWLAGRLIDLGYVKPLPLDLMENVGNLDPSLANPAWDPTGEYSLPWQTGMTGIAYNIEATGRELTSVNDLFDPEFEGKVGCLLEMRDTMVLLMLAEGISREEIATSVTFAQAQPAFDRLEEAVESGQIRKFTGNDYQDDLVNGDFAVNIAWSGDVAQLTLDNENLRFIIPEEGGHNWADVMLMVETSNRDEQVAAWCDYFFDVENAARVANYVQFISPVAGIEGALAELDEAAPDNPLIFPPDDVRERLVQIRTLDADEEERFDERFAQITGA